jgi:hypothetical protein
MSSSDPGSLKPLKCTAARFVEVEFPRQLRPIKLVMKNWMFFGSLEAGTNNALIYTLLANRRAQILDPEDYLVEVLKRLPHNATPEQAAESTPARIAAERKAKAEVEADQAA